jgi:hypothetical protein
MRYFFIVIVSLTLLGMANAPFAEMYKWTDANGVRHYTNEPPPEGVSASSSWEETVSTVRETPVTVIGNSIIVPVTFGYRGRVYNMKLLLDTGAQYTVV